MNYSRVYQNFLLSHALLPYYLGKGKAFAPLRVQIELTGRCNLKCGFCYQGESYKQGGAADGELNLSDILAVMDQVPRFSLLTFSGGEPLLRNDIFEIISHALESKHLCNMITNGALLNEKIARLMVEERFFLLNLSIDGMEDVHDKLRGVAGTFRRVSENLNFLIDYKKKTKSRFPLVDIKTVLTMQNIGQLEELYGFCEKNSVDYLTLSLMKRSKIQFNGSKLYKNLNDEVFYKDYHRAAEDYEISLLESALLGLEARKGKVRIRYYPRFSRAGEIAGYLRNSKSSLSGYAYPCLEPWSGFQINVFGDVYPCLAYAVGNIREEKLMDIWNSPRYIEFRSRLKNLKLFPACNGCCYLGIRRKR